MNKISEIVLSSGDDSAIFALSCKVKVGSLSANELLVAVEQYGEALEFVEEQTEEICLEAVKKNGWALQYVKKQTEAICLEAVKQEGLALEFVEEQTHEICLEAVKQNPSAVSYVDRCSKTQ